MRFNTRPLYQQVADEFIVRIVDGRWAAGQAIENEADLARSLEISLGTIRKAFDILVDLDLIERSQGRGTTVADLGSEKMLGRFSNIQDRSGGRVVESIEIRDPRIEKFDPAIVGVLGVQRNTPIMHFQRLRSHAGRRYMIEDVYMPVDSSAAKLPASDLAEIAAARWIGRHLAVRKSEKASAVLASEDDKIELGLVGAGKGPAVVLALTRVIFSYQDKPLELRRARCDLGDDLFYVTD